MPRRKTEHRVTVTRVIEQGTRHDTERLLIHCSVCGELCDGGDPTEEESVTKL